MKFPAPLRQGRLVRRYKRFLSDVELTGDNGVTELVTAHIANPGAMTGLAEPGMEVWLSRSDNPARKLRWSWELVRVGKHLVGVNTAFPNRIVEEALRAGAIPELSEYGHIRREVRYGANSRIDFLLQDDRNPDGEAAPGLPDCYVEIKNVHLKRRLNAEFPDSVTARGTKHLKELGLVAQSGRRAVMLYLVQRADCGTFSIAADIDPTYAEALHIARRAGVEVLCYRCHVSTGGISLDSAMPVAI